MCSKKLGCKTAVGNGESGSLLAFVVRNQLRGSGKINLANKASCLSSVRY